MFPLPDYLDEEMISIDVHINLGSRPFHYTLQTDSRRIVLFGPSGSGKTTLLKLLAGFFDPDEGIITIDGMTYFNKMERINMPLYARRIGYLPQEYTLFPHMSVRQNIMYGTSFLTGENISPGERCKSLARRLGIINRLDAMPHSLSGGEQQRVALARALFIDPRILLLDEPFNALDTETRLRLRDLVLDITDDMDIITFFVTHDLDEAFIMGEDLAVINRGVIYEHGPKKNIFSKPECIETARLLGFTNEFPLRTVDRTRIETSQGHILEHSSSHPRGTYAVIRPDQIMILREDTDAKDIRENVFSAVIDDIRERIRITDVQVTIPDKTLFISLPHHAAERLNLSAGKQIYISLKKESLILCDLYK